MKKPLLTSIFFIILLSFSFAQRKKQEAVDLPIDPYTHLVTYTEVVEADTSASRLMERAIVWVEHFYKSPSSVLKEKDHDKHKIKCRHQFYVYNVDKKGKNLNRGPKIDYTLTVKMEKGKYEYTLTRINPKKSTYFGIENWIDDPKKYDYAQAYLGQIDKFAKDLIEDLKKWMQPYEEEKPGW